VGEVTVATAAPGKHIWWQCYLQMCKLLIKLTLVQRKDHAVNADVDVHVDIERGASEKE
jgi:hypothetical protein